MAVAALVAAGCSGSHPHTPPSGAPTTAAPGTADPDASLTMVLGPAPAQWNPLVAGSVTGGGSGEAAPTTTSTSPTTTSTTAGPSQGPGSTGTPGGAVTGVAASDAAVVAAGVLPSAFIEQPDLAMSLNRDLLESARLTSMTPPTVVYRINPRA
ncbi:MAG TPA: hypothetical protein VKU91_02850, partial [Acidimicrobiales bacterium]|nr:hypothetical protein [Acidimicrobiales bacterium]